MIQNAHQARELSKASDDPKLEQTLEVIEHWASKGLFCGTLGLYPMPDKLVNNLRARGFSVNQGTGYISW